MESSDASWGSTRIGDGEDACPFDGIASECDSGLADVPAGAAQNNPTSSTPTQTADRPRFHLDVWFIDGLLFRCNVERRSVMRRMPLVANEPAASARWMQRIPNPAGLL
jgi:hypothetical protein